MARFQRPAPLRFAPAPAPSGRHHHPALSAAPALGVSRQGVDSGLPIIVWEGLDGAWWVSVEAWAPPEYHALPGVESPSGIPVALYGSARDAMRAVWPELSRILGLSLRELDEHMRDSGC